MDQVWKECRSLAEAHAGLTGCRTLDALQVASALVLGAREFITADRRQTTLAAKAGLSVTDPTRHGPGDQPSNTTAGRSLRNKAPGAGQTGGCKRSQG